MFMNVQNVTPNETMPMKIISRKPNSNGQYENTVKCIINGRIAGVSEKKNFRITSGVIGNKDSKYIICSNLPEDVKPLDYLEVEGELKLINSVGYYYEQGNILNYGIFSPEHLKARCPKGLNVGGE